MFGRTHKKAEEDLRNEFSPQAATGGHDSLQLIRTGETAEF